MTSRISRRSFIAAAGVSSLVAGCTKPSHQAQTPTETGPGREPFWAPGPGATVTRNLTPGTTPIRLGAFLAPEPKQNPADLVAPLVKQGFTGYFVGRFDVWDKRPDSQIEEFKAALKQHDAVVFEVAGYTNMLHPDDAVRRQNLANLAKSVETADRLGCPMVGTISGSRDGKGSGITVHPENWTLATWKLLVDGIKQVLKDTAGMKAGIGMEAQVTTNLDSPLAHKRLMDDVGDPRCGVNLDPVNMVSLANYYHTTELLNECFDLCGEQILGAHSKDTFILDQQTVHVQEVCSGRGVMDYETYLVRLSRMKWPRTLMPEHIPADQFDEAYAYIRKVADKVGVKIHGV